jgi:3'(2'), 5'-bisphosphate nucleotidase
MQSLTVDQNEAICRLLLQAGKTARAAEEQTLAVYEKGLQDYVTNVDRDLDQCLAKGITRLFPGDSIITEENSQSRRLFQDSARRLWLIDPIDGTEEFIHRGDGYAVMLGLLENYTPQAGWIYAPARDCLYWGGPDWGLFWATGQGWPCQLEPRPPTASVCPVLLGYRDQQQFGDAIGQALTAGKAPSGLPLAYPTAGMIACQTSGSFGLKVLAVIQGQAGIYLYLNQRVKLWDTVGPLALARAAGLVCCDLAGQPLQFNPTAIDPYTLAHHQAIVIGWPSYLDSFLPQLQRALQQADYPG